MKKILLAITLLFCGISFSQKYSRVKINADAIGLKQLSDLGVTIDHGTYKENTFFISDFSDVEITTMQNNGFNIEILIEDVVKYYVHQNLLGTEPVDKNATCSGTSGSNGFSPTTPVNFNQGTMGGYLTYQQMLDELDAMTAQYPSLISARAPISSFLTYQNRPLYYVKISDNPSTDEAAETKVLYTAIHHAREPMALMETIFYMWYLLENYNTNDEAKYIVDNMQLYFVPCVNPDGYVYNQTTNPSGGGMWRKNRRLNSGGSYGVDLNRNYSYQWGTTGTSATQSNDTYCGTASFSEPETQAMRWLVQNNNFISAFNAHTYAEDILFPIGTTTAEFAAHHDYFQDESNHQVQYNGYTAIKSSTLYPASGDSDDYMYKVDIGVGLKDTMFVHTPEVGTSFWQPASEIDATCKEMVFPNLVLAHISRKYLIVKDTDPSTIATLTGNFNHSANRLGLEDGAITVSIVPLLNIVSVGSPVVYNVPVRTITSGMFSYSLNPAIQFGDEIKYILETNNGMWIHRDTITKTYGALTVQIVENGSNANWTGTWGTTTSTFVSASQSYTDTPGSNYTSNANRIYTYTPTIDLTNVTAATVSYYAKWTLETDYDFTQFQVSVDGGTTWIGQCTNYTVPGNSANGSVQPNNQPVYEGTQSTWVLDEVNLSDYLGQVIKVRFQLKSDNGSNLDGFYFDDFQVMYNDPIAAVTPVTAFSAVVTSICEGQSVTFNDLSSNTPTTWEWDFGDGNGNGSSLQSPIYTFSTAGNYTIVLTASNSAGSNVSTLTNYITVNANPVVSLVSSDADNIVCLDGGTVQLTPLPVGSLLSGTGVSGTVFDPAIAGLGIHIITADYTDGNICQGAGTISINVQDCAGLGTLESEGFAILPNPNDGNFILIGLEIGSEFDVFDMNGKLLKHATTELQKQVVNIENVRSGIYYLQLVKNGQLRRLKLVIL
jgi:PKD repeat protein